MEPRKRKYWKAHPYTLNKPHITCNIPVYPDVEPSHIKRNQVVNVCLKVNEILSKDEIEDNCLKERADPKDRAEDGENRVTKWYIAKKDDVEVAFISLDFLERQKILWIHEIFILKQYRKQGLGSNILKWIEGKAKVYGSDKIWLKPKSIDNTDNTIDDNYLERWYSKRGFAICKAQSDTLEKIL